MKEVVSFILNIGMTCLVTFLLNLNLLEKRRYQKFKKLNLELDIILKIAELENKESQLSDRIRRCLKRVCEEMKEIWNV